MSTEMFNAILIGMVAFFFGLLVVVLGWIGSRVHSKLDNLYEVLDTKLGETNTKLGFIERDLRQEMVNLDRRVSWMEGGKPVTVVTKEGRQNVS